ncbi:outer membrane lipoprotein carrier protein LolA [Bacillaceae bacterium S4-13-58]
MKKRFLFLIFASLMLILSACGDQSKEDVIEGLENKLENLNSYKTEAKMTLKTGEEEQQYNIEVWHKKPEYYRVMLKNNRDEKGSQIILRNDDGVFVLTPALNKSFKFQSDWPFNSSQPYLYASLVDDILKDPEATFEATEDHYVFTTKTNYQDNKSLPKQEIYFDKKSYAPAKVRVLDKDNNTLVEVTYAGFEFDKSFEDNAFDMETNMTSGVDGVPVMANGDGEQLAQELTVLYPLVTPEGTELEEEKQVQLENGERVILTFKGDKNFTLIEEYKEVQPTSASQTVNVEGDPVNLGFTMGALKEKSLEWSYKGMDFVLASEDLTQEEMIEIAQSVTGQGVK